ncbi:REP-associated tyrosine transposase [Coralloluteibacterium stylophorae]|uniref:Transposase n=1 Tax=Coralloluteibacterium stylophorae TaxID=1776034 RepID=A0AAP2CAN2_9GAMM|nr:transposase [Coralloluteibacterium stylophorae]MBS7457373.1 transposase [Coralloluteibacterium stylophorae]
MSVASARRGYRLLRRGRLGEAGRIYLLTTVTHRRQPLFSRWHLAAAASRALGGPGSWCDARLLCWVLMPDHWHGLVELGGGESLAASMQRAKGRSARAVNAVRGGSGPVWAPGFHDRALRREEALLDAARYIVANPVRAGLVRRVGDYPFWDAVWLPGGGSRG